MGFCFSFFTLATLNGKHAKLYFVFQFMLIVFCYPQLNYMRHLLILLALAYYSYSCSSSATDLLPKISNEGVHIAYTMTGKGDTALVFVHGWCINNSYWQSQVNYFGNRYSVVAIDLGGHGASGHNRNSWTLHDFANDVVAVIDTLQLKQVILVGHSMGGDIVLDAALQRPGRVKGLIGIDNFKDVGVLYGPEVQQQIDTFVQMLKANYRATAGAYSIASLFPAGYTDTVSVNRVINDITAMDSLVAIPAIESVIAAKPAAQLQQLKIPLKLIVSDYTPTLTDSLQKYCGAGYSVKTIHGTGHYPMIEQPETFNRLLEETLNEISAGK